MSIAYRLRYTAERYGLAAPKAATLMMEAADTITELRKENEKLRELMRIMHGELVSCEDNGYVCGGHKFDDRVRELGVEVD